MYNLLFNFDQIVYQQMQLFQSSWATPAMVFITNLLSPIALPIFALLLIIWFWHKNQINKIALIIFSLGGGFVLEIIIKIIIARPRPSIELIMEPGYSFPSGHATLAAIFFLLLIYCFNKKINNAVVRRLFIVANIALFILVGFSRVYLGMHWLSDVMAGFILGIFWLALSIFIFTKLKYD